MDEAKLSIFATLDAPVPPSKKGLSEFFFGLNHEMRQEFVELFFGWNEAKLLFLVFYRRRERVWSTTLDDINAAVEKYLGNAKHSAAVVGTEAMAEELAAKSDWQIK